MTDLEPGQIGLFLLIAFCYAVSLIALIPPIRNEAQQNKSIRITIISTLGFVVCMFIFLTATRLDTETSFESPPHGVVSGIWDDFEHMQSGAFFIDEKTEEELIWDDIVLQYISRERFLRYTRPPSLRHYCFTGHTVACRWADIDLVNFENKHEWIDFLIRLMIGITSGVVTGSMIWLQYRRQKSTSTIRFGLT